MNSKKPRRLRSQRAVSNVFAIFNDSQIQEFKEVFNMIDQNRDGVIDHNDLQEIFSSLGKETTDAFLNEMINEAPGPINFTTFLTLFGTKMSGTDPEDVIRNAFQSFDYHNTGKLSEEAVREVLMRSGDRFTDNEVDDLLRDAPIQNGMLDYNEFCRLLKHGKKEESNS